MPSNATPTLQSFNPHAVHYFTSAATASRQSNGTPAGVPRAAYPTHILVASTSPTSQSNAVPIQTPSSQRSSFSSSTSGTSAFAASSSPSSNALKMEGVKIQAPRPIVQAKGFSVSKGIFEPFSHQRSVTPELDDVLKKKTAPWGQWELDPASK